MKKFAVLLLAVSAALSAWSQGAPNEPKAIGKLKDVKGLVTVSSGDRLSNAVADAPFAKGVRIVTTSSGAVTLDFDNGCDIVLDANQSITVEDSADCAAMLARVTPVGAPVVAAGSSLLVPGLVFTGGAMAIIIGSNNRNKTSGS